MRRYQHYFLWETPTPEVRKTFAINVISVSGWKGLQIGVKRDKQMSGSMTYTAILEIKVHGVFLVYKLRKCQHNLLTFESVKSHMDSANICQVTGQCRKVWTVWNSLFSVKYLQFLGKALLHPHILDIWAQPTLSSSSSPPSSQPASISLLPSLLRLTHLIMLFIPQLTHTAGSVRRLMNK